MSDINKELQKLKERLNEKFHEIIDNGTDSGCVYDLSDIIEANIKGVEMALDIVINNSSDNWIPCSKAMPEDTAEYAGRHVINVIVETNKGLITKVQRIHRKNYDGVYDRWSWGRIFGDVIAWQPLPERYKGE